MDWITEIENEMHQRKQLTETQREVEAFLNGLIKTYERQSEKNPSDRLDNILTLLRVTKMHNNKVWKAKEQLEKELTKVMEVNKAYEIQATKD